MEEAMAFIQSTLQSKDSHYQMILREKIEWQQSTYDCLWLTAINDQYECMDIILSPEH